MTVAFLPSVIVRKLGATALVLIAFLSTTAFPQNPLPPGRNEQDVQDVVRITSNPIQVDAVITDTAGNKVTDLKADEIQIFEDGKQQKISHFSYIGGTRPTAPGLSTSSTKAG